MFIRGWDEMDDYTFDRIWNWRCCHNFILVVWDLGHLWNQSRSVKGLRTLECYEYRHLLSTGMLGNSRSYGHILRMKRIWDLGDLQGSPSFIRTLTFFCTSCLWKFWYISAAARRVRARTKMPVVSLSNRCTILGHSTASNFNTGTSHEESIVHHDVISHTYYPISGSTLFPSFPTL
jgi:hypothetical protein